MGNLDNGEVLTKILAKLEDLDRKVTALTAEVNYSTKTPLLLRDAAEICHVELNWLRERVAWKNIPAYRSGPAAPWRVFPKDITAFVMAETNIKKPRRKSLLRILREDND
ncbi:hypothetical protein [Geomonas propionica]|uniref:DNA-binding protein n=1 Tax=Geomonas propionica TaxID=2798582 RepID=A0ABS0YKW3_9BACT|nr:hypothetical protein [Geomonas propionica]MBJ6798626.1 hypothetical protein [Geomonas propionica]